ncbi:copper resistance CopC family protein [Paenibacillus silvisoli]|uniref:copper resistance CopC family protein n=1 Tax=Paenibacillus silvisoli TaxID=3110539 RepID=UPI002803F665|nr:copper resistance protein CopC [Paenibacillus silvisoli]
MNKWLAAGLILFIALLLPQVVSAHTDLKASTPAKGETVTTEIKEIQLNFATEIEPVVVLKIRDASNTEIPVQVEAGTDTMTGKLEAPLADGTYTVNWRIIGEDGHNIKGDYSFTVALPKEPEEAPAPDQSAVPGQTTTENSPSSNTANEGSANAQNDSSTTTGNETTTVVEEKPAEIVLPEQFTEAADTGANQRKIWTAIIAVACLGALLLLFRSVMKK